MMKYIHNLEVKVDQENFSVETKRTDMTNRIKHFKYNKSKSLLKYNTQKLEYDKIFDNMKWYIRTLFN